MESNKTRETYTHLVPSTSGLLIRFIVITSKRKQQSTTTAALKIFFDTSIVTHTNNQCTTKYHPILYQSCFKANLHQPSLATS